MCLSRSRLTAEIDTVERAASSIEEFVSGSDVRQNFETFPIVVALLGRVAESAAISTWLLGAVVALTD